MRAYPAGATQKAAAIRRLDEAIGDGRFPTSDGASPATLLTIVANAADSRTMEQATGIPASLALLTQESITFLSRDTEAANDLARDWIEAASPGADLTAVPGAMVLWLLDEVASSAAGPLGLQIPAAFAAVRDAHARAVAGEAIDRTAWAALREQAIAATDGGSPTEPGLMNRIAETLSWPAISSRTILTEAARLFAEMRATWAQQGAGDDSGQDAEIRRTMDALFRETAAEREADPEGYSFPDLFAARHPAMSARFIERLGAADAAYADAFVLCARRCIALMRATPVA